MLATLIKMKYFFAFFNDNNKKNMKRAFYFLKYFEQSLLIL